MRRVEAEGDDQREDHQTDQGVQQMLAPEDHRTARHQALQLGEGDQRAGEGDDADDDAQAHLDPAADLDHPVMQDAVGLRVVEGGRRSEEHTSELQSLMRISYAVFCLKKKKKSNQYT